MHKKRLGFIYAVFLFCMLYLLVSQANICFFRGEEYTKSAVSQRVTTVADKVYRGKFLDRNLVPLVENTTENGMPVRYGQNSLARHLIGYVDGDGVGVSGLEKVFESNIKAKSHAERRIITSADGKEVTFFGSSLKEGKYLSDNVVLTIDSHIQRIAEEELLESGATGAVVVLDTQSFDVLAMASSPAFDQNRVEDYLSLKNGALINRCLSPYNAGSIFKIVTYSAAMEFGRLHEYYNCTGSVDVYENTFSCHKEGGHGLLSHKDSFAKSCNCAFYTMGLGLGDDAILEMARRFGLGEKVIEGYDGLFESAGNVPDEGKTVFVDAVNLSIGQGSLLLTPLQGAKMACIIANNGVAKSVNVARELRSCDGRRKVSIASCGEERVISEQTAKSLKQAMESATIDGTAMSLSDSSARIGGKTGTAETGWVKDGKSLVHGWFCGYFPKEEPRYAMAVLVEGGGSGAKSALPVFRSVAERIMEIYPDL